MRLKTGLLGLLSLLFGVVCGVEAGAVEFPAMAEVKGDRVRIRTGPSFNNFPIHSLTRGSRLVADGLEGDWYRVYLPPYVPCWIHGDFVQPQSDGSMQVVGTRVRVRGTAGTQHAPVGFAGDGQVVRPTGKRDKTGKWLQCAAPFGTKVYIHKDYLDLGKRVPADRLAALVNELVPGRPAVAKRGQEKTTDNDPGRGIEAGHRAGKLTPRLSGLYERFQAERKKPPLQWNFSPYLAELNRIRRTTEDLGEVDSAERWIKWIDEQLLPIQAGLRKLEEEKIIARGKVPAREETNNDIKGSASKYPAGKKERFLATGWVVAMGKNRKVDATHKLMKGNKLLFYLKSDQQNLDRFVNKRVGIQGILKELPPEFGAREIGVTSIQVLSK